MSRINAYRCDTQGCNVVGLAHERNVLAVSAKEHYCVDHYPYERCAVCHRKVRPYSAQQGMWPGTVAKGASDPIRCMECYRGNTAQENSITPQQQDHITQLINHYGKDDFDRAWLMFAFFGDRTVLSETYWRRGSKNSRAKVTEDQVRAIRGRHRRGETMTALAKEYGMSMYGIRAIIHRRTWQHVLD